MARDNSQNRHKWCDNNPPFKRMVHKRSNFPCSMIVTQTARRRKSVPDVYEIRQNKMWNDLFIYDTTENGA